MDEKVGIVLVVATVFFGFYNIIKCLTDFLLRRKIIKSGHFEKAGILEPYAETQENNYYPTLKWGLVSFFGGLGLLVIDLIGNAGGAAWVQQEHSALPLGIELIFISAGFLIYFFIVNRKK